MPCTGMMQSGETRLCRPAPISPSGDESEANKGRMGAKAHAGTGPGANPAASARRAPHEGQRTRRTTDTPKREREAPQAQRHTQAQPSENTSATPRTRERHTEGQQHTASHGQKNTRKKAPQAQRHARAQPSENTCRPSPRTPESGLENKRNDRCSPCTQGLLVVRVRVPYSCVGKPESEWRVPFSTGGKGDSHGRVCLWIGKHHFSAKKNCGKFQTKAASNGVGCPTYHGRKVPIFWVGDWHDCAAGHEHVQSLVARSISVAASVAMTTADDDCR